jgi:hypothetical protein
MNEVQKYVSSIDVPLKYVESGNALRMLNQLVAVASNTLPTKPNSEMVKQLELTLRRIVSARKELALHANGIKSFLRTLKKLRS